MMAGAAALLLLAMAGGGFLLRKSFQSEAVAVTQNEPTVNQPLTDTPDPVPSPPVSTKPNEERTEVVPPPVSKPPVRPEMVSTKPRIVQVEPPKAEPPKPEPVKAELPKPEPVKLETGPPASPMMGLGGLRKSEVTWGGSLSPGADLTVTGNRASTGNISVGGLQLRPGKVLVLEPASGLEVVAGPSSAAWSTVILRNATGRELRRIRLRWEPQP